MKFLLENWTRA